MLGRLLVLNITSYNGYTFPAAETVETTSYRVTPVYDSARRTVIYSQFDITLRWIIADENTTDVECADMVARLQRPAGILAYTGRGFATPSPVNVGVLYDADWGPRPGPVQLEPTGDGHTIRATWQVTFCLATCPDATYKGVREFCFSLDYSIDRSGLTTRTYKAHVSIAQTRPNVNARVIPDTADRFLELITIAPLLGFRRESQQRSLSEDKSTLQLTVVDVQLPAFAPPPGCVDAQFEHSYTSAQGNFAKWTGTFTATYEVASSATIARDTVAAVDDFLQRCDQRLTLVATMQKGRGLPGALGPDAGQPLTRQGIIPVGFSVAEPDAYARRKIRISMSYFIAGMGLSEILARGGLWLPIGGQYNTWLQLTPTIFAPRGAAALAFKVSDDGIVDLCGDTPPKAPGGSGGAGGSPGRSSVPGVYSPGSSVTSPSQVQSQGFQTQLQKVFPPPAPETSWIEYRPRISVMPDSGRVVGTTLPATPISTSRGQGGAWDALQGATAGVPAGSPFPPLAAQLGASPSASQSVGASPNASGSGGAFVQQRTAAVLYATLEGYAVRVGYPIPVPELVAVGGMTPTLIGRPEFHQEIVGTALVPVYGARWKLDYVFTGGNTPRVPVPAPANPYLA